MTVITHMNVDLDAACSVWAAKILGPYGDHNIRFVPANWPGPVVEGDVAVDIPVGIKGEESCFGTLLSMWGTPEDKAALRAVRAFVDAQDSSGSAIKALAPDLDRGVQQVFAGTCMNAIFRAGQRQLAGHDHRTVEWWGEILTGLHKAGLARLRAEQEADKAQLFGPVALVVNSREFATNGVLFERGIRAVVFVDGLNLGVCREGSEKTRMDHPAIKAVVTAAGELEEWFSHPAGFLFARGTRKAPATTASAVNPELLARAVWDALEQEQP